MKGFNKSMSGGGPIFLNDDGGGEDIFCGQDKLRRGGVALGVGGGEGKMRGRAMW